MIARVAEALYWTGRYCARIESHARLLNVNFHSYHEWAGNPEDRAILWNRLIEVMGQTPAFQERSSTYDDTSVLSFMTLDCSNENSIISCLTRARNNLRSVRERVSSRLWETLNDSFLWLKEQSMDNIIESSPYMFYQAVTNHIALFQGIADSCMLRGAEWYFIHSGLNIERADNTLRIISMLQRGLRDFSQENSPISQRQLITLFLRSADSYKTYRKFYDDDFSFEAVAELLLFNPLLPRTVMFSFQNLERQLQAILSDEGYSRAQKAGKLIRSINSYIARLDPDSFREKDIEKELAVLIAASGQVAQNITEVFFREGTVCQ